jgi:integrase
LYGAGLRCREAIAVDLEHYAPDTTTLQIPAGADYPARWLPVAPGGGAALETRLAVRGRQPGPLFCPLQRTADCLPGRLTPSMLESIVAQRAAEARVGPVSPRDLRCTFLDDLYDAGTDAPTVYMLAGQVSSLRAGEHPLPIASAQQAALVRLRVPYRPRAGESV